jgi:hypothetical protein
VRHGLEALSGMAEAGGVQVFAFEPATVSSVHAAWQAASDAVVFDAGKGGWHVDPILRFYDEDAAKLDWLADYLRDPGTTSLVHDLLDPPEEADEEEVFQKNIVLGLDLGGGY